MTTVRVSNSTTSGSYNGSAPGRRQIIFWTNARMQLIWPSGTNVSALLVEIQDNASENTVCKMAANSSKPQCGKDKTHRRIPSRLNGDAYMMH